MLFSTLVVETGLNSSNALCVGVELELLFKIVIPRKFSTRDAGGAKITRSAV